MSAAAEVPVTIIKPRRGWAGLGLVEVWKYRDLLVILAKREVSVRYKQTVLGAAWAVLQPLAAMVIFTIFLGRLAKVPSDGVAYHVFAFAGLVPWTYFAGALSGAANSVVEHRDVITKVYFPRLILPLAPLVSGLVDFGIALGVLVGLMLVSGIYPTWTILLVPVFTLMAMVCALGAGIWLAGLNALYRDFRYTLGFLIQVWLFATPVVYPASLVPERFRALYGLNPMAGVIEGFRWSLLSGAEGAQVPPPGPMLAVSMAVMVVVLLAGLEFFRRLERTFVDRV
jgi:lipopolysaccharide transport system permease protein